MITHNQATQAEINFTASEFPRTVSFVMRRSSGPVDFWDIFIQFILENLCEFLYKDP